jgi:Na+-transporting methylmalonyl-CoA/oxaloacetate decarboxylase beta subunit
MISANAATITLLCVGLFLLVLIPLLDGSKRFYKYISLRYTLVSVVLIMALGCVLDFSHLAESSRNIVLWGGVLLTGLFVVVRSLEKIKLKNKQITVEAHKGDIGASVEVKRNEENR